MYNVNFNKIIVLLVVFFYPFLSLYSSSIQEVIGFPWTYVFALLFLLTFVFNLKGVYKFIINIMPYYYMGVIILICSLLWSVEYTRGLYYILVLIYTPLFAFSIYKLKILKQVWRTFAYSTIIFSILLYFGILQKGFEYYDFGGNRFGYLRGNGITLDPNWLGVWLTLSLFYFFLTIMNEKPFLERNISYIKKVCYIVLSVLSLYFLFITGSRSALLGLGVSILIYLILKRYYNLKLISILGISAIIFISFNLFSDDYSVISRISEINVQDDERVELIISSINAIKDSNSSILIGYGAGGGDRAVGSFYSDAHVHEDGIPRYNNHNTYLDWILQLGVIGIFMLVGAIYWLYKSVILSIKLENISFILTLTFILIQALFYNPIKDGIFVISFGFAIALYLYNKQLKSNEQI